MFSFITFLREALYDGIEINGKYVEVFKNPSLKEFAEATGNAPIQGYQIPAALEKYGKKAYAPAALMDPHGDIFLFDREVANHIQVQTHAKIAKPSIPLYFYYFPSTMTLAYSIAYFSVAHNSFEMDDIPHLLVKVAKNPKLKMFKTLVDSNNGNVIKR